MRSALCAFILILSLLAFYQLSVRLVSQIQYHQSKNLLLKGYYGLAVNHLKKAAHYQPGDYRIQRELGKTCYKVAELKTDAEGAFLLTRKAKDHYLKSFQLNPLDAETAYGLARGEARLERMYQYFHPEKKDNPYQPLPYFKQAISLNPNGVLNHYVMARYLYNHDKEEELLSVVRTLAQIYPPVCDYLEKEPFWSPSVKEAFKTGLQQAIEKNISNRDAHKAMSYLLAGEKDWSDAISHYKQALKYETKRNNTEDFLQLGSLYLKNGQFEKAEKCFFQGLNISRTREKYLERLYYLYKDEGYSTKLYQFYQQVGRCIPLSSRMNILIARSLIDLRLYDHAQQILMDVNQDDPTAEAHYWLARIAEAEKDWDSMELAIQKATVLDPTNSDYHLLFSQALVRMNKLDRAEKEADLAARHLLKQSPWPLNQRGWIRWIKQDYVGALKDWQSAITLAPHIVSFYAQVAEVYTKLEDLSLAMEYYQRAIKLDPKNKRYQKRYRKLKDILKTHSSQGCSETCFALHGAGRTTHKALQIL